MIRKQNNIIRCSWPGTSQIMIDYHDKEWGVPVYDDFKLFEFLVLDAFQAGLSWSTVLNKRKNFSKAFDSFNPVKIARYNEIKINSLLNNPGIIRNKLKIAATIENAKVFLEILDQTCSFSNFIWQFTDGKPIINKYKESSQIPATSNISDAMSKELRRRGFKFVGSTICYAFMQAAGMLNDHLTNCFRYNEINNLK